MRSAAHVTVVVLVLTGVVLLLVGAMGVGDARTLAARGETVEVQPMDGDSGGWFLAGGQTVVTEQSNGQLVVDPTNPRLHASSVGEAATEGWTLIGFGVVALAAGAALHGRREIATPRRRVATQPSWAP